MVDVYCYIRSKTKKYIFPIAVENRDGNYILEFDIRTSSIRVMFLYRCFSFFFTLQYEIGSKLVPSNGGFSRIVSCPYHAVLYHTKLSINTN